MVVFTLASCIARDAALEVAQRVRYVKALAPEFEDRCRQILGTLVRLVFPLRR